MDNTQFDKTILIVDDEPGNVTILAELLDNYKVLIASSGKKAIDIVFSETNVDLILLDINMPVMNGFEVAEKIKSDPAKGKIPIIFVSAKTDLESFVQGFELGAEDYITKPVDSNVLAYTVNSKLFPKHD